MIERDQLVIQARVTLRDIEPSIWRLLLLPQDRSHQVLKPPSRETTDRATGAPKLG